MNIAFTKNSPLNHVLGQKFAAERKPGKGFIKPKKIKSLYHSAPRLIVRTATILQNPITNDLIFNTITFEKGLYFFFFFFTTHA